MSKQKTLEIIKGLHIKCVFLDTEHLFLLLVNLFNYHENTDVKGDIAQNVYNTYYTPKSFLLRNISIVGIQKSTVLVNIFRVFMCLLPMKNAGPIRIIHLQCFKMRSIFFKSYYIGMMDDVITLSFYDSEMKSE